MKAALCTQTKAPLEFVDIAVDNPKAHEVLIRTKAVGLCHSDLKFIDGGFPYAFPFVPGHEAVGVVEKVGDAVTRLKAGDHVVTVLTAFCGHCEQCVTGHITLCQEPETKRDEDAPQRLQRTDLTPVHQFLNLSAYAEMMLVHESSCVAINRDIPFDRAALLGCAVLTGCGSVFYDSKVEPGETVAIIGCGGIGLAAINAAKIAGAGRIIAIDPLKSKRALAQKLGATHVYDSAQEGLTDTIIADTRGGCHKVIEAVGRSSAVTMAWGITRRGGTTTILGMVAPDDPVVLPGPSFLQGRKLQGSLLGSAPFPVTIPRLVDFYMTGALNLDALVHEILPFDQINHGLDNLRSGEQLRTVIAFDQ
jgi:S-(hydroxymethyl)glutathione dehydrogenase/alcohol dehydrogenase